MKSHYKLPKEAIKQKNLSNYQMKNGNSLVLGLFLVLVWKMTSKVKSKLHAKNQHPRSHESGPEFVSMD